MPFRVWVEPMMKPLVLADTSSTAPLEFASPTVITELLAMEPEAPNASVPALTVVAPV